LQKELTTIRKEKNNLSIFKHEGLSSDEVDLLGYNELKVEGEYYPTDEEIAHNEEMIKFAIDFEKKHEKNLEKYSKQKRLSAIHKLRNNVKRENQTHYSKAKSQTKLKFERAKHWQLVQ